MMVERKGVPLPLDPQAEALLRSFAEAGMPALDALPPDQARVVFDEAFRTPPEALAAVHRVEELRMPGPGGEVPLRLYAASDEAGLPLLLHYHGGGWVIGSLETHDGFCRSLAIAAGCAVLAVDYRLAPDHRFPAAFEDCYAALGWAEKNARQLGIDAERLGVIGDSAGGNLAAAVALHARDANGPRLEQQVLLYPALDPTMASASIRENADGYFLTESAMRWFWGHYCGDGADLRDPRLSPPCADSLAGLPPALVITAGFDPLRDEGDAYAAALGRAGCEVEHVRYDAMFHGFALMGEQLDDGRAAVAQVAASVRKRFGS